MAVRMAYLYILKSLRIDRFYIGITENIDQRLRQHNDGESSYTKTILPVILVFKQEFENIRIARKAETWLKKSKNKNLIQKIINDGKITKQF
jgi:putative endonuclease